jgi:hypothetical protein
VQKGHLLEKQAKYFIDPGRTGSHAEVSSRPVRGKFQGVSFRAGLDDRCHVDEHVRVRR